MVAASQRRSHIRLTSYRSIVKNICMACLVYSWKEPAAAGTTAAARNRARKPGDDPCRGE